jgi:hypothetical protein
MPLPNRRLIGLLPVLLVACGQWGRVGGEPTPSRSSGVTQVLDPGTTYRRLGRLIGSAELPFIGDIAFYGGPADSTVALLSVSLQTRQFGFQREGEFFIARYQATWNATPIGGGGVVRPSATTRVCCTRTDSSLPPGNGGSRCRSPTS